MDKSGIFDRSKYNKKTLDTFEIMAAYFVDIYYNHLYHEAKKLRTNNNVSSITEGYKHALNAFMQGIENPKLYKKTLVGIHGYFELSGFSSMTFSECIERMTVEFIPQDYYSSVTKPQKTSLLKHVLSQSNKQFIEKLVRKFLHLIIDNHMDEDNTRILQDEFIDVLIMERENVYHLFISAQTKTTKSTVNSSTVDAMKNEIKGLYKEKFELKKTSNIMKKIIIKKDETVKQLMEEISELKDENIELVDKVNQLENTINELKSTQSIQTTQFMQPMSIPHNISLDNIFNADNMSKFPPNSQVNITHQSNSSEYMPITPNVENTLDDIDIEDPGRKVNRDITEFLNEVENNNATEREAKSDKASDTETEKKDDVEISNFFDLEDF